MTLEGIRNGLMHELTTNINIWLKELDNTNPGHYGIEDWEVLIESDNSIYVDIPNREFRFKEIVIRADLRLGGSGDESSFFHQYRDFASGKGSFEFINNNQSVRISDINIEMNLELFDES